MPVTTATTANDIINSVAAEVGLTPIPDPLTSQDANFIQMKYLLNTAGQELAIAHNWGFLYRTFNIDTSADNSGNYPLPTDFARIANQTAWELNNRVPVIMLTPQQWSMLEGRQFAKDTIYAKFRLQHGNFTLFPQPTPPNLNIQFEYLSSYWVEQVGVVTAYNESTASASDVTVGTDKPLFDRTLISRLLKVKWLTSKGLDAMSAQLDFDQLYDTLTGYDKGGKVLNAAGASTGIPLLNARNNVGDTGYGL